MRLVRLVLLSVITAGLAACATLPAAEVPPPPPPAATDLDGFLYGRAVAVPPPIPVAAPGPAPLPVPPVVLPGPAPGGNEPYTLDSGDRLRVGVFGQDGLSNTYIVDATGKSSASRVTARQKVPLIAPVRPGDTVTVSERWF